MAIRFCARFVCTEVYPAMSALHYAAWKGYLGMCKLLVGARKDAAHLKSILNAAGREGITALHLAIAFGHSELYEFLVDKGADTEGEFNKDVFALKDETRVLLRAVCVCMAGNDDG